MSRIAIIGAGISGLTAAYHLSRHHEVTVLEGAGRLGGHTNTILVESSRGPLPVDTGFIVHNELTYPNFCRLMRELGVATQPSDMSFAVTSPDGFEYSSHGLPGFFAQKSNWMRPRHYLLLKEIVRFNRIAPCLLEQDSPEQSLSLADYLQTHRFSRDFLDRYLYPMAAAIWSTPTALMEQFPAHTLVRFFVNHGLLSINDHPTWRTIQGGSRRYLEPLTRPFCDRIRLGIHVEQVRRSAKQVTIRYRHNGASAMDEGGMEAARHYASGEPQEESFDEVVFACGGRHILPMLADASPQERDILSSFTANRNEAILHTDESLMPRREIARASWNYLLNDPARPQDGDAPAPRFTVTYDMNRLQSLATRERYLVSLNPGHRVDPRKILRRIVYFHPIFSDAAIQAQSAWDLISGTNRTHYCGAYWRYGFHEDGVVSALRVVESIGAQSRTPVPVYA